MAVSSIGRSIRRGIIGTLVCAIGLLAIVRRRWFVASILRGRWSSLSEVDLDVAGMRWGWTVAAVGLSAVVGTIVCSIVRRVVRCAFGRRWWWSRQGISESELGQIAGWERRCEHQAASKEKNES